MSRCPALRPAAAASARMEADSGRGDLLELGVRGFRPTLSPVLGLRGPSEPIFCPHFFAHLLLWSRLTQTKAETKGQCYTEERTGRGGSVLAHLVSLRRVFSRMLNRKLEVSLSLRSVKRQTHFDGRKMATIQVLFPSGVARDPLCRPERSSAAGRGAQAVRRFSLPVLLPGGGGSLTALAARSSGIGVKNKAKHEA